MAKPPKRSHSKVNDLPKALFDEVNRKIIDGFTYKEIEDYLKSMKQNISRSSINRYGQKFIAKTEKIKLFQNQAKIIMEQSGDHPALEIIEATGQMALQVIMEYLVDLDSLKGAKATEVLKSLALLQRGTVQIERFKLDIRKKADGAIKNIEDKTREIKELPPETLSYIKEQIYGITT